MHHSRERKVVYTARVPRVRRLRSRFYLARAPMSAPFTRAPLTRCVHGARSSWTAFEVSASPLVWALFL